MTAVQNINLKRLNTAANSIYVPTEIEKQDLFTIGTSEHICSGYARGLYKVLTGLIIPVYIKTPAGKSGASPRSTKHLATKYKIYPNPAADVLTITNIKASITYSYDIINMLGNVKGEGTIEERNEDMIDISTLSSGLYYLLISENEGQSISIKFV